LGFPKVVRKIIFGRGGAKCRDCGVKWGHPNFAMLECHHIVPTSEGGKDDPSNGVLVCRPCHAKRHERLSEIHRKAGRKKFANQNAYAARLIRHRPFKRRGYE
jgi:5-methylcytosine-specific restriction endonuclease McrA